MTILSSDIVGLSSDYRRISSNRLSIGGSTSGSFSVELDEKGYPVMLATPPGEKAALCDKEEEWDSLQEGEKTPLKEGKSKKRKAAPLQEGSAKSKPSTMWRRMGLWFL